VLVGWLALWAFEGLTLIHAEYRHPWDPLFRALGWGTAADHHVHHSLFKYNYGL
jgi:lathosterol oxidase